MKAKAWELLRARRKELRYKLADVARYAGVSVSTVSDAEHGRINASAEATKGAAKFLFRGDPHSIQRVLMAWVVERTGLTEADLRPTPANA